MTRSLLKILDEFRRDDPVFTATYQWRFREIYEEAGAEYSRNIPQRSLADCRNVFVYEAAKIGWYRNRTDYQEQELREFYKEMKHKR